LFEKIYRCHPKGELKKSQGSRPGILSARQEGEDELSSSNGQEKKVCRLVDYSFRIGV